MENPHVPNCKEFRAGLKKFDKLVGRDPTHRMATLLINKFWGQWDIVADAMIILLVVWNQAFYRYGNPDWNKLEKWLRKRGKIIKNLHRRSIDSFSIKDEKVVRTLFNELLNILGIKVKKRFARSPVAVAKALYLLAPEFFPLWDGKIAKAYGCSWGTSGNAAQKYILFFEINKATKKELRSCIDNLSALHNKSALKLIDQYNYAKYTEKWI